MELQSVVAIALGAASVASGFALWRWAKNLPEGYEDNEGFHFGGQPVPVHALQDIPRTSTAPGHDGPCAAVPANSNLPALTFVQRAVLIEMSEEIGYTAAVLAANTQAPHKLVVQARRDLAKLGLAELVWLNGDGGESNQVAGRGYILTREGARVRGELLAQTWVAA